MKDTLISALMGVLMGGAIVYGFVWYQGTQHTPTSSQGQQMGGTRNFDPSTMSDEQLSRMAERIGISTQELKSKIAAGEDIRSLMPQRSGSGNFNRNGSGSFNRGNAPSGAQTGNNL